MSGKKATTGRVGGAAGSGAESAGSSGGVKSSGKRESDSSPAGGRKRQGESTRETVEAIAIAFVLAFVFKTFQAEAYVIPTGSMAPTLFGRHKEAVCEACQYQFPIGASQEIDQESGIVQWRIDESECPNCRFTNYVRDAPVFNGDRILVNKQVRQYRRFDVVVFKNPEEPHVNYIKRLVGLPGETIRVRQGDIHARRSDSDPWRIQRKDDLSAQRAIQLLVYDDRFPPRLLLEAGAEERWAPSRPADRRHATPADDPSAELFWSPVQNLWQPDADRREYRVDAARTADGADDEGVHWLRYRHLLPTSENWRQAKYDRKLERELEPSLIVDFCGFNSFSAAGGQFLRDRYDDGLFWVGDLTINLRVDVETVTDDAVIVLELVEGLRWYRCRINLATGNADIQLVNRLIDQQQEVPELLTSVQTPVRGPGSYDLTFANVDDRLALWVNNQLIPLGEQAEFNLSAAAEATDADLTPAGIGARGWKGTVSQLLLQRDLYYRNDTIDFIGDRGTTHDPIYRSESRLTGEIPRESIYKLATLIRSPSRYSALYLELADQQQRRLETRDEYRLADDEYLMFGDNSPASKDSRLFDYNARPMQGRGGHRYAVQERDLIGEALFVFWPHGIPFMNGGQGYALMNHRERTGGGVIRSDYPVYRVPFYPNVSRMKRIR